jgi:FKBP-type peptidyl-prolyl cis-trans isomerase 2
LGLIRYIIPTFAALLIIKQISMSIVKDNSRVKAHYTGTLSDGQIFDSSEGREPLEFTMGLGQLIPGFENAVLGMQLNESKVFTIPSNEAYGEVREDLFYQIPNAHIPEEISPAIGMQLTFESPEEGQIMLTVTEVADEYITVDANHPLAGKDLTFNITVVDIN